MTVEVNESLPYDELHDRRHPHQARRLFNPNACRLVLGAASTGTDCEMARRPINYASDFIDFGDVGGDLTEDPASGGRSRTSAAELPAPREFQPDWRPCVRMEVEPAGTKRTISGDPDPHDPSHSQTSILSQRNTNSTGAEK